ncbi:MAG: transposase [Cyanobacteria bacterium J06626_4]
MHLEIIEDELALILELPAYSPELNHIEILWQFTKYDELEAKAYER